MDELTQLIARYGNLLDARSLAYEQYAQLEIKVLNCGNEIAALTGDFAAINAEYESRQKPKTISSPAPSHK